MTRLTWRESQRQDKELLKSFTCATPVQKIKVRPWKLPHKQPWALSLQTEIHEMSPVCWNHRVALLGFDDAGLAAVTVAEVAGRSDEVVIECVAVDVRCAGEHYGDEALEQSVQWAMNVADAAGEDHVFVTAKTHPENKQGRSLIMRAGFGELVSDEKFVTWAQWIPLPDPSEPPAQGRSNYGTAPSPRG